MVSLSESLTTVVVTNYRTLDLTRACVESVRRFWPDIPLLLIDNGSGDESTAYVQHLNGANTHSVLLPANMGHGPALDLGMRLSQTPFVLTLDSDCDVFDGSFLPLLIEMLGGERLYAAGWLRHVNRQGVSAVEPCDVTHFCPYLHPAVGLYKREIYFRLPPFLNMGAPATWNMYEAHRLGYPVVGFPVFDYVHHWIAGTRRMFDGKWNIPEGRVPSLWDPSRNFPI